MELQNLENAENVQPSIANPGAFYTLIQYLKHRYLSFL